MALLLALSLVFLLVALTRPGPNRLFRGRYRRKTQPLRPTRETTDPTSAFRDPARPF
jgi:hypothetical protein